jgi:hypothetical protein
LAASSKGAFITIDQAQMKTTVAMAKTNSWKIMLG